MTVDATLSRLDDALRDSSLPKRVKLVLERVKGDIAGNKKDKDISITSAIYDLDELVNDVNIPMHAKTVIWDIIGVLEALKG